MKLKDIPEILDFLPEGANLNADINDRIIDRSREYPSLLHWACERQNIKLIEILLVNSEKYELDINALDVRKNPALVGVVAYFAQAAALPVYNAFLKAGANFSIPVSMSVSSQLTSIFPLDAALRGKDLRDESQFSSMKSLLATVYDRHFYEEGKTKLAIALALTDAFSAGGNSMLQLISDYAFGLFNDLTERKDIQELASLSELCKRAYDACKEEQSLRERNQLLNKLYDEIGPSGFKNLVALVNLAGENGIAKLAAFLNQPAPSACPEQPEQNAHPAVLSFRSSSSSSSSSASSSSSSSSPVPNVTIHTTSPSSSSSASLARNLSSHSSSSRKLGNRPNPRDNHPRWGQFKRK